ncbi:hypothetical protein PV398_48735, partial [Streptomyces ipomoeae]|nr:hypothetical protein [Streptomyces ipomoeae]
CHPAGGPRLWSRHVSRRGSNRTSLTRRGPRTSRQGQSPELHPFTAGHAPRASSVGGVGGKPYTGVAADPADGAGDSGPTTTTDGTATIPPAEADDAPQGTVVFRRPDTGARSRAAEGAETAQSDGTMTFRTNSPRAGQGGGGAAGAAGVFGAPLTDAQIAAQQALGLTPQSTPAPTPPSSAPSPTPSTAPSGPQQGPQ